MRLRFHQGAWEQGYGFISCTEVSGRWTTCLIPGSFHQKTSSRPFIVVSVQVLEFGTSCSQNAFFQSGTRPSVYLDVSTKRRLSVTNLSSENNNVSTECSSRHHVSKH